MGAVQVQQNATVAIVEDDVHVREALATYLGARRFQVSTFNSAEEALADGGLAKFSVVISDLTLPGEDGLSLLRSLSATAGHRFTVLITGSETDDPAVVSARGSVDALLQKPFTGEELGEELGRLEGERAAAGSDSITNVVL
jgi:DNA-binding response OmpR family regulator